jgi:hypothetical protein
MSYHAVLLSGVAHFRFCDHRLYGGSSSGSTGVAFRK